MDWNAAIEKNREALKRVLAMLVAMAGLSMTPTRQSDDRRPPLEGEVDHQTLPRHLHRAVLRLLRPAEAATRRLIIVAARGMVVARRSRLALPQAPDTENAPAKQTVPGPPPLTPPHRGKGAVRVAPRLMVNVPSGNGAESPSLLWGGVRGGGRPTSTYRRGMTRNPGNAATPPRLSFPLFDPLRRFHHRRSARLGVPRICFPGFSDPFPIPLPPSPDDTIDATRLALRFAALARVLDDLPREARRFARWKAHRNQETNSQAKSPSPLWGGVRGGGDCPHIRRLWPLRLGPPPGLPRRPSHAVHDILEVTHGLAFWALEQPDTS